jgi:hypothetical protein
MALHVSSATASVYRHDRPGLSRLTGTGSHENRRAVCRVPNQTFFLWRVLMRCLFWYHHPLRALHVIVCLRSPVEHE